MIQGDSTLIANGATEADGRGDSAAGGQFLKGMAVDHITSAWSSAELALGRLVKDKAPEPWGGRVPEPWGGMAQEPWGGRAPEPWGGRAPEPWGGMAQEPWGGRALAPWCGMAPWFGGCMVPGEEAGRAVSPDAAEAVEVGCRAASADGNSSFKGG